MSEDARKEDDPLDPVARMIAEWECCKLVHRFNLLNDAGMWDEAAACFAEDGSYLTPLAPEPIRGRAALAADFAAKPDWVFRHFVTNVVVDLVSGDEARGRSYVLVALNPEHDAAKAVATGAALTGEVEEHFVRTPDGWRFGDRRGSGGIPFGTTFP